MNRLKPAKPKIVHVQPELQEPSEELTMEQPGIDLVEEMSQLFKGYYQTFVGYSGGDVQIPSQASTRYALVRQTGGGFWSSSSLKTGVAGFGTILTTLSVGFLLSDEFNNPLASAPLDYTVPAGLISTPDDPLSDLDLDLLSPSEQPSRVNPVEFSASALPIVPVPGLPPIQMVEDGAEVGRAGDRPQSVATPATPQQVQLTSRASAAESDGSGSRVATPETPNAAAGPASGEAPEASGAIADGSVEAPSAGVEASTGGPTPEPASEVASVAEQDANQEGASEAAQAASEDTGQMRLANATGGSSAGRVESAEANSGGVATPIQVGDRQITPVVANGFQSVGLTSEAGDDFVLTCSGRDALLKSIATLVMNEGGQDSATITADKEVNSDPLLAECTLGRGLLPEGLRDQPAHLIYGVVAPDQMPEVFRDQVAIRPTGHSR